jgi:predicted metal-dependent enzyme (double-stranded beta helix superfamily)
VPVVQLAPAQLAVVAESMAAAQSVRAPLALDGDRGFELLVRTDEFEAWLIDWAPTGALDLHDHGGSTGVVRVVSGWLAESFTDLGEGGPLRTCRIEPDRTRHVPATRIHEVWNPGPHRARSVHAYSPPLSTMTYYEPRPGGTLALRAG